LINRIANDIDYHLDMEGWGVILGNKGGGVVFRAITVKSPLIDLISSIKARRFPLRGKDILLLQYLHFPHPCRSLTPTPQLPARTLNLQSYLFYRAARFKRPPAIAPCIALTTTSLW